MNKDQKFSDLVGVRRAVNSDLMELPFANHVQNHIGNMHASAQFALAEIASGDFMRSHFSEFGKQVLAVVRRAEIKYSKAVSEDVQATVTLDEAEEIRFRQQLDKKGRALLAVQVKLKTASGEIATSAVYHWYVSL